MQPPFHHSKSGFSLVEVTLAIGILAFCMIPLIGLLPTGLNTQHNAAESASAASALAMLSTAVSSSQISSRGALGAVTYRLPQYLSDSTSAATSPTTYTAGQPASTYTYGILEDGSIRKTTDTKPARQTMYVKIFPPATPTQLSSASAMVPSPSTAVQAYAIVAWPALPTDGPTMTVDKLKSRQGYVETYITYAPPN